MTTIAHLIGTGGHVIMVNDVYGGTNRFFTKVSPNYGLSLTLINMNDPAKLKLAIRENTKVHRWLLFNRIIYKHASVAVDDLDRNSDKSNFTNCRY